MLTDKQKHLYTLFKEVDELCRKNNIDYQLAGGTLIGAVRHRGFIPWDDDMDITMTRNNWEKFVEVCKTQLPDNRILECQELNHNFHNVIARYTDKTSSAVHSTQVIANDTAGDMIDIICYDYLPDSGKSWEKYTRDITLYSDLINPCIVYSYRFCANQFRYGFYRLKMRIFGRDKVLDKLQERMFSYKEEDCPYLVLRWGGTPLLFKKEIFGNSKNNVLFVDTMGQAPDFINDYLVEHYEDEWMFVPPATEQGGHNSIYSLDLDYRVIRKEINHFISPQEETKKFLRKKSIAMQIMAPWLILKNLNILATGRKKSKYFTDYFEKNKKEIIDAHRYKNYIRLEEIFSEFFALQFDKDYFGRDDYDNVYKYRHPIIIKIPDDMADKAVYTLFNRNKISKALRMIQVYEDKNRATEFMLDLKEEIMSFRNAVHNLSLESYNSAYDETYKLDKKHPYSIGVIKLRIITLMKMGIDKNRRELTSLIDRGFEQYPNDGELMKYRLDLENKGENEVFLVPQYINAYHNTLNGLVRLDIEDILLRHLNSFDTTQKVKDAFEILKDNRELCERFIDLTIEGENTKDICSLLKFSKDNQELLGDDYKLYVEKICENLAKDEDASALMAKIRLCNDYSLLTDLEKESESIKNEFWKSYLQGEIQYKKGNTQRAVELYISASSATDKKLLALLSKKFYAQLRFLKEQFSYCESLTHICVETGEEKPADNAQKEKVLADFITKWTAPFSDGETLTKTLRNVGIMGDDAVISSLDYKSLEFLLDSLDISGETESISLKDLDPLKNKVDGPLHNDKDLIEEGDFDE
ncbi:MAG: LicD family protein [Ruminococcus sp.]